MGGRAQRALEESPWPPGPQAGPRCPSRVRAFAWPQAGPSLPARATHRPPPSQPCSLPASQERRKKLLHPRRGTKASPWTQGLRDQGPVLLPWLGRAARGDGDPACWRGGSGPAPSTGTLGSACWALQPHHVSARTHRCPCICTHCTRTHARVHTRTLAHGCTQTHIGTEAVSSSRRVALASPESGRNKSSRLATSLNPFLPLLCIPLRAARTN